MSEPERQGRPVARGFGGFRSTGVILALSALAGLSGLAAALLPDALQLELWGPTPSALASRAALGSLERAQTALADASVDRDAGRIEAQRALSQAAGALSILAAPSRSLIGPPLWWGLGALFGTLLLLWWWLEKRWAGPLSEAERLAWLHIHGETLTTVDPDLGARDARSLARMINALIEHGHARAEANLENDRAAFAELERALWSLGGGDLSAVTPTVTGNLEPIARAIEAARRDLAGRVREIHGEASALAEGSAAMAKASRRMAAAFGEQREALTRISETAEQSGKELESAARRLEEGLEGLQLFSRELRRSAQQHRAELSVAARRMQELRTALAELAAAEGRLESLEDCLQLLDDFRRQPPPSDEAGEGAKVLSTRAALALKRGRESVESLRQDLSRVQGDASRVALNLAESTSASAPSGAELEPTVLGALQETGLSALRIEERLLDALRLLERGAAELSGGAELISKEAERARGAGPRLARSIADLRLDGHLEAQVLNHLAQLEADMVIDQESGLSPMGRAALLVIQESAQASKVRVSRLIAQTEATLDIVRGA